MTAVKAPAIAVMKEPVDEEQIEKDMLVWYILFSNLFSMLLFTVLASPNSTSVGPLRKHVWQTHLGPLRKILLGSLRM
jgi:uncharacterized integral membrane protein